MPPLMFRPPRPFANPQRQQHAPSNPVAPNAVGLYSPILLHCPTVSVARLIVVVFHLTNGTTCWSRTPSLGLPPCFSAAITFCPVGQEGDNWRQPATTKSKAVLPNPNGDKKGKRFSCNPSPIYRSATTPPSSLRLRQATTAAPPLIATQSSGIPAPASLYCPIILILLDLWRSHPLESNSKGLQRQGLTIQGIGHVAWSFVDNAGMLRMLKISAYHVPGGTAQLLSTNSLLQTYPGESIHQMGDRLIPSGDKQNNVRGIEICTEPQSNLPVGYTYEAPSSPKL